MAVTLEPAVHKLTVSDQMQLAARPADGVVDFVMNAALRVIRSEPAVREMPVGADATFFGINGTGDATGRQVGVKRYRATLTPDQTSLSVSYEGVIDFGLSDQREQYTRGFRETSGILGAEGVYLAGSSFWYPSFNRELIEFELNVTQPAAWQVISQGNGTSRDAQGHARWESGGAMDEIYLVGGPLQVWRDAAGSVETLVYLHDKDDSTAGKYLAATAQYLEMYRQLIGPYPYRKFALVENFWETGYGMPTFTLLGREIIRFPFIINSSYPHEILHNWWGNSVFVDYESGNWCEGLTAYLADHLIAEQRGTGDEYRRSTLQKYRDYVKEGRDFPLTAFRSRESASTEAVGYGKALMAYHMLRLSVGDDAFRKGIARFYRDFKGKRASFADFQKTMEAVGRPRLHPVLRGLGWQAWRARAGRRGDRRQKRHLERGRRVRRGRHSTPDAGWRAVRRGCAGRRSDGEGRGGEDRAPRGRRAGLRGDRRRRAARWSTSIRDSTSSASSTPARHLRRSARSSASPACWRCCRRRRRRPNSRRGASCSRDGRAPATPSR